MAETQTKATDLIGMLEKFFKQAPNLPENAREVLVKIAPWLSLIFGILGILGGLSLLGFSPLALFGGLSSSMVVLLSGVVSIVASVLMLMAYPKLVKRQYKGWELLFWSEAVSVVSVVISVVISFSIVSLLFVLIGFYLLFQIKSYYK